MTDQELTDVPEILGVVEIVLNVNDLPAMKKFYREVLGFSLVSEGNFEDPPDNEGAPTISFFKIAEADSPLGRNGHPISLALIDYRRHAFSKAKFKALEISKSPLNHLAFEIPPASYRDHLERLKRLGLEPAEASFPNMQADAIFFKDPEGNTLELICWSGGSR